MASNFTHFLTSFGEDPQQLEAFKQDPHAVMDAAGLTPAEKTLLLSGNTQLIRSALVSDPGLKEALGIPPDQSLPARIPAFISIGGLGGTLYGTPTTFSPPILYWCKVDHHIVTHSEVQEKDVDGRPLCPTHHEPMADLPTSFWCIIGHHIVDSDEPKDLKRDESGHPLCPTHNQPMIESKEGVN